MISGSDVYLDGSLPFPEISNTGTTGISPDVHTAGTSSSSLTQTLSGSDGHSGNGIIPTLSTVTHTFSRPINTSGSQSSLPGTVGVSTTGSRPPASYYGYVFPSSGAPPLPAWSHPSWPQPNPGYPNQSFPGYWPSPMPFGDAGRFPLSAPPGMPVSSGAAPVPTTSSGDLGTASSNNPSMDMVKQLFADLQKSMKEDFNSLSTRLTALESRPVANELHSSPVSEIGEEEPEADELSVAPRSQERDFLSDEDDENPSTPQATEQTSAPPTVVHHSVHDASSKDTETEEGTSQKDLRDRTYILMRDVAKVPFASPPKPKRFTSNFEASCGLNQGSGNSRNSFPESNHMGTALQIINEIISNNSGDKASNSKFSGFGIASFSDHFRAKDYEIFNSTLGRLVPSCDKSMSNLLGAKPVDGLRLSQSTWAKTENLLRSTSQVLGTAEHFLASAGFLLKSKDCGVPAELQSFLYQVDKALSTSQLLLMGSLGNFTLSKRSEILDKSHVSESLKDSLSKSPLTDKIFGLPLQQVQEEVSKNPQTVKVNVQLDNGKRSVSSTSSQGAFFKRRKVVKQVKSGPSASKNPKNPGGSKGYKKSGGKP